VCRCCSLLVRCSPVIRCEEGVVDGDFVGCAEGNSIARLQVAGTGKDHLPSNDADGGERELAGESIVSRSYDGVEDMWLRFVKV